MSRLCMIMLALVLGLAALTACTQQAPSFTGADISGASYGAPFQLHGSDGKGHTLADFKGKYVMLFFGFTQFSVLRHEKTPKVGVQLLGFSSAQGLFCCLDSRDGQPQATIGNDGQHVLMVYLPVSTLLDFIFEQRYQPAVGAALMVHFAATT